MAASTLSVVLINYNHSRYLPESIGAILSQSRRPDEFIVIDDASTDDSVQVIESLLPKEPFVTFLRNEKNQGAVLTARRGWELATGDYLMMAGADDRLLPGFFEKSMRLLAEYPRAGLCSSYCSFLNGATGVISENPTGWCTAPRFFTPAEVAAIPGIQGLPGHASVLKRSAFLDAGAYLPELRWHSDWFNNFVVSFRHGMCHIPESLALFRVLPHSFSATGTRDPLGRKQVYEQIALLLESDTFRDVAPLFYASGALLFMSAVDFLPHQRRRNIPLNRLPGGLPTDALELFLNDAEPDLREQAAFWLRLRHHEFSRVFPLLLPRQNDSDEYVRLAVANTLYSLVSRQTRPNWLAAALTRLTFRIERRVSRGEPTVLKRPKPDWLFRRLSAWAAASLNGGIRPMKAKIEHR